MKGSGNNGSLDNHEIVVFFGYIEIAFAVFMVRPLTLTCLIGLVVLITQPSYSQQQAELDSLLIVLNKIPDDTSKVLVYHRVNHLYNYVQYNP